MKRTDTIGIIEMVNIYPGYEVLDSMLKGAEVEKIMARTVCPGKFIIIIKGDLSSVEAALAIAGDISSASIVSKGLLSNVNEKIFHALSGVTPLDSEDIPGLLIVETYSIAPIFRCADIVLKTVDVNIPRIHAAMAVGGRAYMICTGDMESLKTALEALLEFISGEDVLAGYSLISNPRPEVIQEL